MLRHECSLFFYSTKITHRLLRLDQPGLVLTAAPTYVLTGSFGTKSLGRSGERANHVRPLARDVFPERGRKPPYQRERRADEPLRRQLRERPGVRLPGVRPVERKLLLELTLGFGVNLTKQKRYDTYD